MGPGRNRREEAGNLGWVGPGLRPVGEGSPPPISLFPPVNNKGKRKRHRENLLYPTWIRRDCAVGITGLDRFFRWDTLGVPGRFHDRFYLGITVKEAAL